jgi:hypothetical protein
VGTAFPSGGDRRVGDEGQTNAASSSVSSAPSSSSSASAFAVLSAVGPPITVATALLLYFGWARTDAQAEAMGLDVSVFGYSAQDYILRSVNALYLPLIVLLVAGILWLVADRMLVRLIHRKTDRMADIGWWVIAVGGIGGFVCAVLLLFAPTALALAGPYAAALAVSFALWGVRLLRVSRPRRERPSVAQRAIENTLVFTLVTLLLFWGTADFAQALGRRLAQDYATAVPFLPRADVYSAERLAIGAPAVTEERLESADGTVYHYAGLRLLVASGGQYFLLHDGWTLADGTVVVLPQIGGGMRFEFGN